MCGSPPLAYSLSPSLSPSFSPSFSLSSFSFSARLRALHLPIPATVCPRRVCAQESDDDDEEEDDDDDEELSDLEDFGKGKTVRGRVPACQLLPDPKQLRPRAARPGCRRLFHAPPDAARSLLIRVNRGGLCARPIAPRRTNPRREFRAAAEAGRGGWQGETGAAAAQGKMSESRGGRGAGGGWARE